ncbi:MAG: hypothetical protein HQ567_22895 [Candidatus Nealsonbacteria bacterium]|nr:hypothetical protein [Candidatus Nealsonbacteria bacterium]
MNAVVLMLPLLLAGATDPGESVVAGREALGKASSRYPWYDASTDGVRRVEIDEPTTRSSNSGGGSSLDLGPLLTVTAWSLLIAALVILVFFLIRAALVSEEGVGIGGKKTGKDDADDAARVEALPLPVRAGKSDLLAEAQRLYREGNYRQAIVYLFGYQLVQLDKQQVIRLAKGKTNRQYLREVGPRIALQGLIEQTMVTFEEAFFGNRAIGRVRFESCWTRLSEFDRLAGETA